MRNLISIGILAIVLTSCQPKPQNEFKEYESVLKNNIGALPIKLRETRSEYLKQLQSHPIYKRLVFDKELKPENLPLLTSIGMAWAYSGSKGFLVDDDYAKLLATDTLQYSFFTYCGMVSCRGGLPVEMCEVFQRYAKAYNYYGEKGTINGDSQGNQFTQLISYDLATPMAIIEPHNKEVLDAIVSLHKLGIKDWKKPADGSAYPYLISRDQFIDHLRIVYPESSFIPKFQYQLTAPQLFADYKANEVTADRRYKGKIISVKGVVSSIGKDVLGNAYIALNASEYIGVVQCYPINEDLAAKTNKGDHITLIGKCDGYHIMSVVLKGCDTQ